MYPVALHLSGKPVAVVGGGAVATRKISRLLPSGAVVTVISPDATSAIEGWTQERRLRWLKQTYDFGALSRAYPVLVFAATDSLLVNRQVVADARRIGAWANAVDGETESDFRNLATVEKPPVTVAISTDGTSPALLAVLKSRLEALLTDDVTVLAQWLGELRPQARAYLPEQSERKRLYQTILQSDVPALLQAEEIAAARARFEAIVSEVLV